VRLRLRPGARQREGASRADRVRVRFRPGAGEGDGAGTGRGVRLRFDAGAARTNSIVSWSAKSDAPVSAWESDP
jgi:hypothetical protein